MNTNIRTQIHQATPPSSFVVLLRRHDDEDDAGTRASAAALRAEDGATRDGEGGRALRLFIWRGGGARFGGDERK